MGSFNVRGASFSQQERTWVSLEDGNVPAVQGVVSPSDVHAFTKETPATDVTQRAEQAGQKEALSGAGARGPPEAMYAMYLHCRKEARIVFLRESTPIEIDSLGFELATFSRVLEIRRSQADSTTAAAAAAATESLDAQDGAVFWAAIGLCNMLNSSAAISEQEIGVKGWDQDGAGSAPGVAVSVKGSGCFLALASRTPTRATLQTCQSAINSGSDDQVGDSTDVALEASFMSLQSALVGRKDPTGGRREKRGIGEMGMVEVVIPGPWDGQERRLTFVWN